MGPRPLFALLALTACAPQLSDAVVRAHPPLRSDHRRPRIAGASAQEKPAWLEPDAEEAALIGQGTASSLEAATSRARGDLSEAAARFAGVDLEASLAASDTHSAATESTAALANTRVRTSTAARAVEPEAVYWERVIAEGESEFRVYARAVLARARNAEQPRVTVAIVAEPDCAWAAALALELRLRLEASFSLGAPETARFTVRLGCEERGGRLRARYAMRGGDAPKEGVEERGAGELFALEDAILARVTAELEGAR